MKWNVHVNMDSWADNIELISFQICANIMQSTGQLTFDMRAYNGLHMKWNLRVLIYWSSYQIECGWSCQT